MGAVDIFLLVFLVVFVGGALAYFIYWSYTKQD